MPALEPSKISWCVATLYACTVLSFFTPHSSPTWLSTTLAAWPYTHGPGWASDLEDALEGENPLDLPFDDFDIISGSEPERGHAAPSRKNGSKLSSASASASGGGGGVSEHDSLQDPTDAQDDVLHVDMDNFVLPPPYQCLVLACLHEMQRRCIFAEMLTIPRLSRMLSTDTAG